MLTLRQFNIKARIIFTKAIRLIIYIICKYQRRFSPTTSKFTIFLSYHSNYCLKLYLTFHSHYNRKQTQMQYNLQFHLFFPELQKVMSDDSRLNREQKQLNHYYQKYEFHHILLICIDNLLHLKLSYPP